MISALLFLRTKRDVIDESAKEIMKKVDYICLRLFYILTGPLLSLIIFYVYNYINDVRIIGYYVAGEFVLITAIRIILFWVFDSRGME